MIRPGALTLRGEAERAGLVQPGEKTDQGDLKGDSQCLQGDYQEGLSGFSQEFIVGRQKTMNIS